MTFLETLLSALNHSEMTLEEAIVETQAHMGYISVEEKMAYRKSLKN